MLLPPQVGKALGIREIRACNDMILHPLERMFHDLLPYFLALQVSVLSRRTRLKLEAYKFCQTTTKGCAIILLLVACFTELPLELKSVMWDMLH